jgi:hypothetical protein
MGVSEDVSILPPLKHRFIIFLSLHHPDNSKEVKPPHYRPGVAQRVAGS